MRAGLWLSALVVISGCNRNRTPEPQGRTEEATEPAAASATGPSSEAPPEPSAAHGQQATWTDPAVWKRVPSTSPMRMATYRVPRADGDREDGEVSVFHFGATGGGDVKSNLDRWEKQFSDVDKGSIRQTERKA